MVGSHTTRWVALERWSPTFFFVAGGAWIIDTVPYALELLVEVSIPEPLSGALLLIAFMFTVAGALGLYPPLAAKTPILALVGTLLSVLAGLVLLASFAWVLGAGLLGRSMPPGVLLVLVIILSLLTVLIFGLASVRCNVPSRACGVLLLALAATWTVWIAGILGVLSSPPNWASTILGVLMAAITLSIGAVLHIGGYPLERSGTAGSPAIE